MGPPGSPALLTLMVKQVDEKHEEGHGRLREDVNKMLRKIESLEHAHVDNLLKFERLSEHKERRTELSGRQTVIIAAGITAGARLLEFVLTLVFKS